MPQARALVDEALERYAAGGSTRAASLTLSDFAYAAILQEDYATAGEVLATARALAHDVGEPFPLAHTRGNQALVALFTDDDETATNAFRDELLLAHEYVFPLMAVEALGGLSAIAASRGDTERSGRLYGAYLAQAQDTPPQPVDDRVQRQILAPARQVLDADAWDAAVQRGRDMTSKRRSDTSSGDYHSPPVCTGRIAGDGSSPA